MTETKGFNSTPKKDDEILSNVEILVKKPSEIKEEDFEKMGLTDLITKGYGAEGSKEELLENAKNKILGDDNRKTLFLAMSDGKAVGLLAMINWRYQEGDKRGKPFGDKLKELNPQLAERILNGSTIPACDVAATTTLPDVRNSGIAAKLLKTAIDALKPSVVVGQTKNVGAVITRTKSLAQEGYRTYYGGVEINDATNDNHLIDDLKKAFEFARGEKPNELGVWFVSPKDLSATLPNVDNAPDVVKKAFSPVIEGQEKAGQDKTAVQSLISIRNDLI